MIQIVPSIASANLLEIKAEIKRASKIGFLHLDIEDGNFSPDITFGIDMVSEIAGATDANLDAHLMVTDPLKYIEPLCKANVSRIAVHIESTLYPSETLSLIHSYNRKAGLALNYKTDVRELEPYIDQIDYVLLQTCEAGDSDLKFKEFCIEKIKRAKRLLPPSIPVWADGGINEEVMAPLAKAGLDFAVIGRALFGAPDLMEAYRKMISKTTFKG